MEGTTVATSAMQKLDLARIKQYLLRKWNVAARRFLEMLSGALLYSSNGLFAIGTLWAFAIFAFQIVAWAKTGVWTPLPAVLIFDTAATKTQDTAARLWQGTELDMESYDLATAAYPVRTLQIPSLEPPTDWYGLHEAFIGMLTWLHGAVLIVFIAILISGLLFALGNWLESEIDRKFY